MLFWFGGEPSGSREVVAQNSSENMHSKSCYQDRLAAISLRLIRNPARRSAIPAQFQPGSALRQHYETHLSWPRTVRDRNAE